jgi:hypothetical protein
MHFMKVESVLMTERLFSRQSESRIYRIFSCRKVGDICTLNSKYKSTRCCISYD